MPTLIDLWALITPYILSYAARIVKQTSIILDKMLKYVHYLLKSDCTAKQGAPTGAPIISNSLLKARLQYRK